MTNKAIARLLKETAALIELTGGNPFRARAFDSAARTLERMEESVSDLVRTGQLTGIQGIGKGLASQIEEILSYGSFEVRDELLGALPPGLLDILAVKGLGAKKARALWQSLGIQSLDDLEAAAQSGRIAELDGFGAKSQTSILDSVALLRSFQGRRRLADAVVEAARIRSSLLEGGFEQAWISGETARRLNDVGCISLVVTGPGSPDLPGIDLYTRDHPDGQLHEGSLPDGLTLRILVCPASHAGTGLFRETGPAAFVDGLLGGKLMTAADEHTLFEALGAPWIAPELRDLPDAHLRMSALAQLDLITDAHLQGVLHNHSTYSDGAHTLREMSLAVRERGYGYFGICDHSQSLKVAGGMSPETVARQQEEIRRLNAGFASDGGPAFRVFSGVESDILADGSLDYDDDVLASFDFVVASVHVGFNMTEAQATERIIRAISHTATSILGHPTGRLILKREGYPINHEAVLQACAAHKVAVELNANPYRLDLDWTWIERARELGVVVSINPDAHSVEQIDLMTWGVAAARKGGLMASECLNALSSDGFAAWLSSRKRT
ncbi:MAG: helix-hairpin-helix domain-containing protein [Bacteroidetes bacterium]|nr:helix-hairpin-helix domain-containing protein [Bacteroidota bacterium]